MAFTPVPQVHTPAPNPSQGNEAFNANTQLFINSLAPAIAGINSAGNQIDQLRDETSAFRNSASTSSGSAQSSAAMAAATANNRGNWSILPTTAAAPPYSVNYAGSVYILQRSLTNVRSVTPGTDPNTWFNYSQSATGLTVVASPTDTTPDRIVNTQWDFYRAVGIHSAISSQSNASFNIDTMIGNGEKHICGSAVNQGLFPPTPGSYVIEAKNLQGWSMQTATLYPGFSNSEPNEMYFRVKGSSAGSYAGREWTPMFGGSGTGDTTSAMQGFVNLGAMGASGAVNATIDLSAGRCFFINLNDANTTGGFTFTLSNIPSSGAVDAVIFVARPTRKGTLVLPSNVKWAGGIVPALSSVSNAIAAIHIWKLPTWTNFRASVNAMEVAP